MEAARPFKTLPGRYYTDTSLFREEMDRFFFEGWICAGRDDVIPNPGDYFLREIAGESVIIVRESAEAVRAFYNVCRHRGTRICSESNGSFTGRIQCPYHGWTYGLDGGLIGAPHMGEADFRREDYPLRAVSVERWDGHVFLNFSENPGFSS